MPDNLKEFEVIELDNFGAIDYKALLEKMVVRENVTFEHFNVVKFEEMILELLQRLNFQKVEWHRKISERGFDFIAEYLNRDPFGIIEKQTWIFECKLYHHARFDIKTIQSVIDSYKYIQRKDAKLALITNSQFTSVVKDYIAQIRNTDFIDIRLIDGYQLKEIISAQPEMLERYFRS